MPGAGGCPTALKLDRYKTKLCLFHMQGRCCKGPHCPYAHGIDELRAPLPPGLLQVIPPHHHHHLRFFQTPPDRVLAPFLWYPT